MQSRYYHPEVGRFLNADAYASTGQGILGNNMFAYCGNNPANRADPTGHAFMQMSFDPDGAHGMLTLGPWGGGSGGVAYAASIRPEGVKKLVNEVGTAISAGAEACWDAYTRDYNRQQNVQMQQAQMNFDGAMAVYDFLNDTGAISAGMAGYHSYQATREWQKAAVYAALPIPTLIDEYFAMAHLIKGAYHWYKCSGEAISWDLKN